MQERDGAMSAVSREVLRAEVADAFELVVVAASAGGVQALTQLVSELPVSFGPPMVVVQHVDPRHRSLLVEILSRRSDIRVDHVEEGAPMEAATVYVAPPGLHVLVNPDATLSLSKAELVHFVRPSADLLFESAAASFTDKVIAVVLTGTGEDGASGVRAIKKMGGTVIAQDEKSSAFFGMPGAAIDTGAVDFVLPLDEIAEALVTLTRPGVK